MKPLALLCLLTALASGGSARADSAAAQRFITPISVLENRLPRTNDPEAYADLVTAKDTDLRARLFTLEVLTWLYADVDSKFGKYRDQVKDFEDAIGKYAQYGEDLDANLTRLAKANQTDPALIDRLTRAKLAGRKAFAQWIVQTPWLNAFDAYLAKFQTFAQAKLGNVAIPDDRRIVSRRLIDLADKIESQNYFDMTLLETGVHELRRQLRWFVMGLQALEGTYVLADSPNGCPVPRYGAELAQADAAGVHGYAGALKFPNGPADPCTISRCLYYQVWKNVQDLGKIKDAAFLRLSQNPQADLSDLFARAAALKSDLVDHALLEGLKADFDACR